MMHCSVTGVGISNRGCHQWLRGEGAVKTVHSRRQDQQLHKMRLSGTNLVRAGDHNQRVTLQAIRVHGNITRTELAEVTGLTPASIVNITKRLLEAKLIVGVGRVQGGRGQPPKLFSINSNGCFSIGVNIDRDHVTVVALDLLGHVRARATLEAAFALPETVAAFFRTAVENMFTARQVDRKRVIGVGVAIPDMLSQTHLPDRPEQYAVWDQVDIPALFGSVMDGPVFTENDATAAALGESQFGLGLRKRSFFYILINAGLGGGLVIEGTQYRGAHGRSGELGFLPLDMGKPGKGTLGHLVSLSTLYDQLRSAGHVVSRPEALEELDADGTRLVDQWIEHSADVLTGPLIAVCCLVDPEAIYIGGRLPAKLVDRLADRINAALANRGTTIPIVPPVRRAAMAADAPAVGAALLPFNDRLLPNRSALMKVAEG